MTTATATQSRFSTAMWHASSSLSPKLLHQMLSHKIRFVCGTYDQPIMCPFSNNAAARQFVFESRKIGMWLVSELNKSDRQIRTNDRNLLNNTEFQLVAKQGKLTHTDRHRYCIELIDHDVQLWPFLALQVVDLPRTEASTRENRLERDGSIRRRRAPANVQNPDANNNQRIFPRLLTEQFRRDVFAKIVEILEHDVFEKQKDSDRYTPQMDMFLVAAIRSGSGPSIDRFMFNYGHLGPSCTLASLLGQAISRLRDDEAVIALLKNHLTVSKKKIQVSIFKPLSRDEDERPSQLSFIFDFVRNHFNTETRRDQAETERQFFGPEIAMFHSIAESRLNYDYTKRIQDPDMVLDEMRAYFMHGDMNRMGALCPLSVRKMAYFMASNRYAVMITRDEYQALIFGAIKTFMTEGLHKHHNAMAIVRFVLLALVKCGMIISYKHRDVSLRRISEVCAIMESKNSFMFQIFVQLLLLPMKRNSINHLLKQLNTHQVPQVAAKVRATFMEQHNLQSRCREVILDKWLYIDSPRKRKKEIDRLFRRVLPQVLRRYLLKPELLGLDDDGL